MWKGGPEPFERGRAAGDPEPVVDRAEALRERVFDNALGALELYTIYLGERLGLYRALAEGGAATSSQLAARTGTTERYVREWLEHHAASELLLVDDPRAEPLARRYWLPPEHVPVLANRDDDRYEACTGVDVVRAGRGLPQLVEAFRVGNAPPPLPWEPEGRAEPNRARFINLLGTEWLPAIPTAPVRPTRVRPGLAKPSPAVLRSGCFAAYACASRAHPVEVQPCLSGKSARRVSAALTQRTRWRTLVSPQGTTPFGGQPPAATRSSSERFNLARQAGRLPGRGAGCCGRWGTEPDAAAGVH
jgi:hypothetical protein